MFKQLKTFSIFSLATLAICVYSCKDDTKEPGDEFKKAELLTNVADNYIIPHYSELQTRIIALESNWNNFLLNQTQNNLDLVKSSMLFSNEQYQRVKPLNFGPGMTSDLVMALGVFPTDTAQITSQINTGVYNFDDADSRDSQGFDALDYLLFRTNALSLIQSSTATQNYISSIIVRMKNKVAATLSEWQTSYRSTFIQGTGTEVTSGFSLFVNAFCRDFETTKTTKLGFPLGTATFNTPAPLKFEAKWSHHNREYLQIGIEASFDLYRGFGTVDGLGFDDYLIAEEQSELNSTIISRYNALNTTIYTWSDNLKDRLNTNSQSLYDFYNYMQGSVVYLKTDMTSAFGVSITYQDSDGD